MMNNVINYVTANQETVILVGIGVCVVVFAGVKTIQRVGLEQIRGYVYKQFVNAEHAFQHGENKEKFEYVVNLAKQAIPAPFNLFITEKLLRKVIQAWFDLTKDLLDDGKLNGTSVTDGE